MQLEDYISAGRLNIYTDVLKLKPGEELGGYNWNKAVSAAMQPLMHCLEVTLRNAIDYSIRHARLPGAAGLWRTDTNWIFDLPRYIGDKTWIAAQLNRLPDCDWQHLVFTLPDTLWALFETNRWLLNDLCRLAVDNLLFAAGKRGRDIGIFCAIHTYGRRLNWHPHVHVSVTSGGINAHGKWKKISFRKDAMRARSVSGY